MEPSPGESRRKKVILVVIGLGGGMRSTEGIVTF